MKQLTSFIPVLLALVLLSACQPAANSVAVQTTAHAWIDAPLDGSHLPLAPVEITAHASGFQHIFSIELSVNGNVIASVSNPNSGLLAVARQTWTPLAPGNYAIRARASDSNGGWGDYAEADVTIGLLAEPSTAKPSPPIPLVPPTPTAVPAPSNTPTPVSVVATPAIVPPTSTRSSAPQPTATHTHTPQPTKTQTVAASKPTLNDHSVSASLFYWGGGNCTPKTVTFTVSASDPAGIASVHISFRLATQSTWTDLAMSSRGGNWAITLDPANDIPGYSTVNGSSSVALQFYFVLTNTKGAQTQSQTFANSTALEYCPAIK